MIPDPPQAPQYQKPIAFRRLLDQAADLSRQHFRTLFWPIAIPMALAQVLYVVGQLTSYRQMGDVMTRLSEADPTAIVPLVGVGCLLGLLFGLFYVMAVGAIFSGTANATYGRPISFASHWGHALKPRVAGTLLMAALLFGFGLICCILPGLALMALFSFAVVATVEDDTTGFGALQRSYDLSGYNPRGEWTSSPRLKLFVLVVVGWILSIAVTLLLQLPLQILQQVMLTRKALDGAPEAMLTSGWMWLSVPNAVLGSLGSTAVLLYLGFGIALLYWDVRSRAEGGDLEAELDALDIPSFAPTEPLG